MISKEKSGSQGCQIVGGHLVVLPLKVLDKAPYHGAESTWEAATSFSTRVSPWRDSLDHAWTGLEFQS